MAIASGGAHGSRVSFLVILSTRLRDQFPDERAGGGRHDRLTRRPEVADVRTSVYEHIRNPHIQPAD
jgi:hypothetical protein